MFPHWRYRCLISLCHMLLLDLPKLSAWLYIAYSDKDIRTSENHRERNASHAQEGRKLWCQFGIGHGRGTRLGWDHGREGSGSRIGSRRKIRGTSPCDGQTITVE